MSKIKQVIQNPNIEAEIMAQVFEELIVLGHQQDVEETIFKHLKEADWQNYYSEQKDKGKIDHLLTWMSCLNLSLWDSKIPQIIQFGYENNLIEDFANVKNELKVYLDNKKSYFNEKETKTLANSLL